MLPKFRYIFASKFLTEVDAENIPIKTMENLPDASYLIHDLQEFLQTKQGKKFRKDVRIIIDFLNLWIRSENLPDIHKYEYALHKFAENFFEDRPYGTIGYDLYRVGIPTLATIIEEILLKDTEYDLFKEGVPLPNSKEEEAFISEILKKVNVSRSDKLIIYEMILGLTLCPPAAKDHINQAYEDLNSDFAVRFMGFRRKAIAQIANQYIKPIEDDLNIEIEPGDEVHYVTTLVDYLAKIYGFKHSNDGFHKQHQLPMQHHLVIKFFQEVKHKLNENYFVDYYTDLTYELISTALNEGKISTLHIYIDKTLSVYGKDTADWMMKELFDEDDDGNFIMSTDAKKHLSRTIFRRFCNSGYFCEFQVIQLDPPKQQASDLQRQLFYIPQYDIRTAYVLDKECRKYFLQFFIEQCQSKNEEMLQKLYAACHHLAPTKAEYLKLMLHFLESDIRDNTETNLLIEFYKPDFQLITWPLASNFDERIFPFVHIILKSNRDPLNLYLFRETKLVEYLNTIPNFLQFIFSLSQYLDPITHVTFLRLLFSKEYTSMLKREIEAGGIKTLIAILIKIHQEFNNSAVEIMKQLGIENAKHAIFLTASHLADLLEILDVEQEVIIQFIKQLGDEFYHHLLLSDPATLMRFLIYYKVDEGKALLRRLGYDYLSKILINYPDQFAEICKYIPDEYLENLTSLPHHTLQAFYTNENAVKTINQLFSSQLRRALLTTYCNSSDEKIFLNFLNLLTGMDITDINLFFASLEDNKFLFDFFENDLEPEGLVEFINLIGFNNFKEIYKNNEPYLLEVFKHDYFLDQKTKNLKFFELIGEDFICEKVIQTFEALCDFLELIPDEMKLKWLQKTCNNIIIKIESTSLMTELIRLLSPLTATNQKKLMDHIIELPLAWQKTNNVEGTLFFLPLIPEDKRFNWLMLNLSEEIKLNVNCAYILAILPMLPYQACELFLAQVKIKIHLNISDYLNHLNTISPEKRSLLIEHTNMNYLKLNINNGESLMQLINHLRPNENKFLRQFINQFSHQADLHCFADQPDLYLRIMNMMRSSNITNSSIFNFNTSNQLTAANSESEPIVKKQKR